MKPFPGKIALIHRGRVNFYSLNEEQEAWLREFYPEHSNRELMESMGVSYPTLYNFSKKFCLRKSADGMKMIYKQAAAKRMQMVKYERMRRMSGYAPRRFNNIKVKPYTKSQVRHRHRAMKRGYLLDEDNSEGSEGRYTIYYDDETNRCPVFERNAIRNGFNFKKNE